MITKENLQQQFLLSDLSERGLEKPFERQTKIAFKNLEKQPFRNEAYYLENYQIQLEQYDFLSENNRTENLPLRDLTENFTIYSITNLLKWHCNILTHKSISKADYNTDFLQYILIHLKKGNYAEIPTIQIYYQIYQALDTGKIEHYQLLKSLLLKSFNQFPIVEIRNILLLTISSEVFLFPCVLAFFRR